MLIHTKNCITIVIIQLSSKLKFIGFMVIRLYGYTVIRLYGYTVVRKLRIFSRFMNRLWYNP